MEIDYEASFFATDNQLIVLVEILDYLDKSYWHLLRLHKIQMFIKYHQILIL